MSLRLRSLAPLNRSALAAGLLGTILSLPLLGFGFTFDQGVFATIADTMRRGGVAYLDAWEHKPPGVFYAYYLAFILLGKEIWAVRSLEVLMMGLSSGLLFRQVERETGSRWGGWVASLLLPLSYVAFGQNSAQAESLEIPLLLLTLLVWPEDAAATGSGPKSFLAGLLMSLALLCKTPFVLVALALFGKRLWQDRKEPGLLRKARLGLLAAGGFLAPPAILFGWYALRGAGQTLVDALFIFPAQYARKGLDHTFRFHLENVLGWTGSLIPASQVALLGVGILRAGRVNRPALARFLLVFLAVWAGVVAQGRYFHYHYLPMLPVLAWGAALCFAKPPAPVHPEQGRPLEPPLPFAVLVAALLSLTTVEYLWWVRPSLRDGLFLARFEEPNGILDAKTNWTALRRMAGLIRENTRASDRIFVWGDEPLLYLIADRPMAGPNSHLMQIVPPWGGGERLSQLLERLRREDPALVVVCPDRLWWRNEETPAQLLASFPAMRDFLAERYSPSETLPGYQLWVRRTEGPAPGNPHGGR